MDNVLVTTWPNGDLLTTYPGTLTNHYPITLLNPNGVNASILMLKDPSLTVREGDILPKQPAIKLVNTQTGEPISGVGCMASIIGINDDIYPRGYEFNLYCNIVRIIE